MMKCRIAALSLFLKIIMIEYLISIFVIPCSIFDIRFFRVSFSIKLAVFWPAAALMYSLPGTYTLILFSAIRKPVKIGKLGILSVKPGFYAYIGSAFGPGGLQARLTHHLSHSGREHWHIDYLSPILNVCEIWHTNDPVRREHHWAQVHAQTRAAVLLLPDFGSSDCRCRSHLFFYKSKPSGCGFRRKIRAKFDGHAGFMVETLNGS